MSPTSRRGGSDLVKGVSGQLLPKPLRRTAEVAEIHREAINHRTIAAPARARARSKRQFVSPSVAALDAERRRWRGGQM